MNLLHSWRFAPRVYGMPAWQVVIAALVTFAVAAVLLWRAFDPKRP